MCNEKFFRFLFSRPLLTMSQVGLAQKVLKFAFSLLCFKCACSKPATFYWLKGLSWSRDQVPVQPLLESSSEKIGGLLAVCTFFLLSPAAQKRTMNFHSHFKATVSKLFLLRLRTHGRMELFSFIFTVFTSLGLSRQCMSIQITYTITKSSSFG
jgi:hypothetical protein